MKSPLNQVIGLGSAKDGTTHWWQQRLTAIALIPLGLWFAISLIRIDLGSHAVVTGWIRQPMTAILLCLTCGCVIYHSWLGVRVVFEDYTRAGAKLAGLLLSSFAHAFVFAVCLFSVLKIAFGAA
jgi:succinate dehydrogenase / fumarate reductase membrane anchor subunit